MLLRNCFVRRSFFISLLLLVCFFTNSIYSQTSEITTLELNKPIEREIKGGQKHLYQITLTENQYAKLIVEQRGIDVVVRTTEADGKLISEFDSEIKIEGVENVELADSSAKTFRLEIIPRLKTASVANYKIVLSEIRSATESDRLLQEARELLFKSSTIYRAGNYKESLPLAERALEIREKYLGSENIEVAAILNTLGNIHSDLNDNSKAETLFKRALSIYENKLGLDHLNVATVLNNLAVIDRLNGNSVEAEKTFLRVLSIREKNLGNNHTLVASVLNNLGILYRNRGDNEKAQQMYERSLKIREQLFGTDSPEVAQVLINLSSLYYYKGDFATALPLDRRVLEIRERNFEPDHPSIALALNNLALNYTDNGEPQKAEPLYRRALAIYEKKFGQDSPNSVPVLNNLAKLYLNTGEYTKAGLPFQKALQIAEKNLPADAPQLALYLHNLGDFYTLTGKREEAELLLKRALVLREKSLGEDNYDVGRTCNALARLFALKGDTAQAIALQERANKINEKNLALNLAVGSEYQKLAYMDLMSENLNLTIALHANIAQENAIAREQAVTAILQRKGRVMDAMANSLALLRRRFDAQDQILFDKLNDINSQLAKISLEAPQGKSLVERQKQIAALQGQKDGIEIQISRRSAGFYESPKPITLAAVQNVIPDNAALIEFAVYSPFDFKKKEGELPFGEPRYIVYVIRKQGEVDWKDLGEVKQIDERIDLFRQALRDPQNQDIQKLARALDEKIMSPIRPLLGDAKQLLISPDGNLNLIPFEALVNEKNQYLIENYSITYLTSGRDLLRMQTTRESKSNSLLMANPLFGEPDSMQTVAAKRQSITATRNLSDTYFAPLGSTAQEARSIQTLFPDATFLSEAQATETALKQITAPKILHIATHGFFLEDDNKNAKTKNPLLRSGLALAGANQRKGETDDGIFTALEASGLNLWGTKLVVLSACDTGLGEVKNGEGVYGLRRAFLLAGTESLVMSLWSVSDFVTRELMTSYYKNLKQGMGRNAALRQVQLEMLKKTNRQHPFYWASFIQSGEWTNLEGKR